MVLRDVAQAFDKMWHNGLKYKVVKLGIPDILENTLCTFLDNRKAIINHGNKYSKDIKLLCGIPQGSVLSPNLHITYTNDLPPPEYDHLDNMYMIAA